MTREVEEAIEHLRTIGEYYSTDHSDPNEEYEILTKDELDAIYLAIKALEQKPNWIPVSERLPEDGRPVLIYAWNVHHVIARYDSFRTENGTKKCWVTADAWNGNVEIKHEVIAWMPLPKPYELQERSGEE